MALFDITQKYEDERKAITEIFRLEHELYSTFIPAQAQTLLGHLDNYYADDITVVHTHHDTHFHKDKRAKLASGHPHLVVDLKSYIAANLTTQIAQLDALHHTMLWLSLREHQLANGASKGVAVVGLVMEGLESLQTGADLDSRDRGYRADYIHLGVWVMRKKDLSKAAFGTDGKPLGKPDGWTTDFVLSGLPQNNLGLPQNNLWSSYTPPVRPTHPLKKIPPPTQPKTLPHPDFTFNSSLIDTQHQTITYGTEELLGWEVVIDGLNP